MASISTLLNYQPVEVAEGVIAFIFDEPHTGIVSGNSIAIAGEDSVLVVDSGHFPSLTKRMIQHLQEVFMKPVRFLVNTHWHPDHWSGNYLYKQEYPDIAILSHPFTRNYIENKQRNYSKEALERVPTILKTLSESLAKGARSDGTPYDDSDKQFLREQIVTLEAFVPELEQMRHEPPTVTLETGIQVDLGGREVKIAHFGRGNTAGDMTVYTPDTRILATGDLVVHPTPYSFGSYLSEWAQTLNRLKSTGASILVPGHGQVQEGWEYVDTLIAVLKSVVDQTLQAVRQNLTLEETRTRIDLEQYRARLAGKDPYRSRAFQSFFVQPAVERGYLEAKLGEEHGI